MIQKLEFESESCATQQVDLFRRVREAIILGHFTQGQRLTEKFIAETMNVKRGPARECLLLLEGQGLVRKIPSLGYFVEQYSEAEIQDAYEVRAALEALAVRHAAEQTDREALIRLQFSCDEMRAALESGDEEKRVREDLAFHEALLQASGSRVLQRVYASLPRPIFGPTRIPAQEAQRAAQQHDAIVDAIRHKEVNLAVQRLQEHLSHRVSAQAL